MAVVPMTLEIVATTDEVRVMVTAREADGLMVVQQLRAQFPEAELTSQNEILATAWAEDGMLEFGVMDFGLWREFVLPLANPGKVDPYASLIGAMAHLNEDEASVYQVIFTPLREPWGEQAVAAVTRRDGKPFYPGAEGEALMKAAQAKASRPLYAVVLRLAAKASTQHRVWSLIRGMAATLRLYSQEGGQSLVPLSNAGYDIADHCEDLRRRRSRRCGMFLTIDELASLAHLPSAAVKSPRLLRAVPKITPPPAVDEAEAGSIFLGWHDEARQSWPIKLSLRRRLQHLHVVGASGTGKSTLLLSMIQQDMASGQGLAVIDPHGELIDQVMARIPPWRWADVVIIDPSDEQHITPLNVLSAHSDYEKTLLASDLVSVFRRLSTTWGDRMNIIFQNLVLAFLEHREGGTLAEMRRFLIDAEWRADYLTGVDDPDIVFYWTETFPKLDGAKSIGPILTRLETLLTPKVIRYMVSQRENLIDFGQIMDAGKILLVRLPQGEIGKENTFMLGSLIMVKLQQMAMSRARMPSRARRPFFCYVDECQHFITGSISEILSGARKYGLGLILAHQDLQQLAENADVAAAVMTNASTRVAFRVSSDDARKLASEFAQDEVKAFIQLPDLHALCRIERSDQVYPLRLDFSYDIDPAAATESRNEVTRLSREHYTLPRADVEAEARRQMASGSPHPSKKGVKAAKGSTQVKPEEPPVGQEATISDVVADTIQIRPDELSIAGTLAEKPSVEVASADTNSTDMHRPSGMGRGGNDHQMIVEQLAREGGQHGYKTSKEASRTGGRADLTLENRLRKIGIEVAVRSNTAEEVDHLTNGLEAGFDFVVSISPVETVRVNIEKAAKKKFSKSELKRLRFFSPESMSSWLTELAEDDAESAPPPPEEIKRIGGRAVRIKHREVSSDERRKVEAEQLEVIATLVNKNRPPERDS
jgi:Type IV secretion-system coupling protein DNA-binding domain